MPFWLAFGIAEEFEQGSGLSACVIDPALESFDTAVASLTDADLPVVAGRVTEANAYVIEARTPQEASLLLRTVFIEQEPSPHVRLVRRNIRTQVRPALPSAVEALGRLHNELCISHELTELALPLVQSKQDCETLGKHKVALEDWGYAIRVMQGDDVPTGTEERSGSERLGYRQGHHEEADSTTLTGMLESLAGELSIAKNQVELAMRAGSPSHTKRFHNLTMELDRFQDTISNMRR